MTTRKWVWWRKAWAFALALVVVAPLGLPFARAAGAAPLGPQQRPGMGNKGKLLLLSGAALLYFLWRKHQANKATAPAATNAGTVNGKQPQLYRSKNGGIYYRDAQGRPVWLTVPQQGYQVSADEVQRYAPDYARYRGPAPAAPAGYRTQPFSAFDNGLAVPGPRN
jgi:hypothetical protein